MPLRLEVQRLVELGPLPGTDSAVAGPETFKKYERLMGAVQAPITDDEAEALLHLFGPDDCFGLAWTLVQLIETSPRWPRMELIATSENTWIALLRERARSR